MFIATSIVVAETETAVKFELTSLYHKSSILTRGGIVDDDEDVVVGLVEGRAEGHGDAPRGHHVPRVRLVDVPARAAAPPDYGIARSHG